MKPIAIQFKPQLEMVAQAECALSRKWVANSHKRLKWIQWALPPQPEHFDHQIDLFHQFMDHRSSYWTERGVFGSLALKGGKVLELACGDGFNARNFYSLRSMAVVACDFDPSALKIAKAKNSAPNVTYLLADIRTDMPQGTFENIVWDAAIEHFTPAEIETLLGEMKMRLTPDGILSGYTLVDNQTGEKQLTHHEYEFRDKEDLRRFFLPHFKNVTVFETVFPDRHNLYFWASDGPVPFAKDWQFALS